MATVKVLIEGYAKKIDKGWKANGTCCLVTFGDKKMIVDPGCNRKALLEGLEKENLTTDQIDYVFMSHKHPDHVLLAGIFENAQYITFDNNSLYEQDIIREFDNNFLGNEVEIINTPGHVPEHISLIVNTSEGRIGIACDAIWWLDGEEQIFSIDQEDHNQATDMDMEKLVESRKKLIENCDFIIPGHGKKFKVKK